MKERKKRCIRRTILLRCLQTGIWTATTGQAHLDSPTQLLRRTGSGRARFETLTQMDQPQTDSDLPYPPLLIVRFQLTQTTASQRLLQVPQLKIGRSHYHQNILFNPNEKCANHSFLVIYKRLHQIFT